MAVPASTSTNSIRPAVATICLLLIVAAMYWARAVAIPVVLSALLTFLLTPAVSWLQRWRVPRVVAAVLTALLAFAFLGGVIATVVVQFPGLSRELTDNSDKIHAKAESVHRMIAGGGTHSLTALLDETINTIVPPKSRPVAPGTTVGKTSPEAVAEATSGSHPAPEAATSNTANFWGPLMEWAFAPALEVFVDAGIVMVLVVFMLAQHEDLRNRMLRMLGTRNVTSSTKALGDAARRVRRYLLMQFFINCSFGLIVAAGLGIIGVPYPWLWGILGAVLRYIPYIGTWLAAVCPVLLSIALSKDWAQPLEALGLFVLLDLLITNVLEPIVYGRSVGVSGTALLIAAVFWTWLWGPIGLILSTPLTACLVVLGRSIPALEFLTVLMGDQPALSLPLSFYQRLLARDEDEATTLVEEYIQKNGVENVYDHMLLPALVHAKENRDRGAMTPADEEFITRTVGEMVEDVVFPAQDVIDAREAREGPPAAAECRLLVLGCPAKDELDELALRMMQRLLPAGKCQVEVMSKVALVAEVLTRVGEAKPAVVCIGAVPPYSFSSIRYLCKRLRAQYPGVKILVGCWGLRDDVKPTTDRLKAAGADYASAELLETRGLLLPLVREAAITRAAETPRPAELVRS